MENIKKFIIDIYLYTASFELLNSIWESIEMIQGIEHNRSNLAYFICNIFLCITITDKIRSYLKND